MLDSLVKLVPVSFLQSTATTKRDTGAETVPDLQSSSKPSRAHAHRTTRSKLWDPPEEDLPLLDSPLEVDSETPVADALIKRLRDEEKEGTASGFSLSCYFVLCPPIPSAGGEGGGVGG